MLHRPLWQSEFCVHGGLPPIVMRGPTGVPFIMSFTLRTNQMLFICEISETWTAPRPFGGPGSGTRKSPESPKDGEPISVELMMVNDPKDVHLAVGPASMPPVPVLVPVELVAVELELELDVELEVGPVDEACVDVPPVPPPPLPAKSNVPKIDVQALAAPVAAARRTARRS
jgi:hypothetical protein